MLVDTVDESLFEYFLALPDELKQLIIDQLPFADIIRFGQSCNFLRQCIYQVEDTRAFVKNPEASIEYALPTKYDNILFYGLRLEKEIHYLNENTPRFESFKKQHEDIYLTQQHQHLELVAGINFIGGNQNEFEPIVQRSLLALNQLNNIEQIAFLYQEFKKKYDVLLAQINSTLQINANFIKLQRLITQINSLIIDFEMMFCSVGQGAGSGENIHLIGITRLSKADIERHQSRFTKVTQLNLQDNYLGYIPDAISICSRLSFLNLYNNPIWYLPHKLSECEDLNTLLLSDGYLPLLPSCIFELKNLEYFNCVNMGLTRVDKRFKNLTRLKEVCLNGNKLISLPQELLSLPKLQDLHVNNNPINSSDYNEITSQACKQLLFSFKQMQRGVSAPQTSSKTKALYNYMKKFGHV